MTDQDIENQRKLLKEAINLHEIEGNPLSAEQVDMFKMFIDEGFSQEEREAYMKSRWSEKLQDSNIAAE